MAKTLVAYFSASGVTEKKANRLAQKLGADIFKIEPEVPYTKADLNWMNKSSRSSVEMADKSSRPAIANMAGDLSEYDVIYLGFPIWWYVAPTIVNTYLESGDFSGKKIVLFATAGSSGFGETVNGLKVSVSDTTEIVEGMVFSGVMAESKFKSWLETL